jgi:hypothetical protein
MSQKVPMGVVHITVSDGGDLPPQKFATVGGANAFARQILREGYEYQCTQPDDSVRTIHISPHSIVQVEVHHVNTKD